MRVSTDGQSVAAQVAALQEAGAVKVFRETASGAQTDRAQLRKALAILDALLRQCLSIRFRLDAWNHLLCPCEKLSLVTALCRGLDLRLEAG